MCSVLLHSNKICELFFWKGSLVVDYLIWTQFYNQLYLLHFCVFSMFLCVFAYPNYETHDWPALLFPSSDCLSGPLFSSTMEPNWTKFEEMFPRIRGSGVSLLPKILLLVTNLVLWLPSCFYFLLKSPYISSTYFDEGELFFKVLLYVYVPVCVCAFVFLCLII